MKSPKYMGDITQNAFNGFEKHCTYEEMLTFLRDPSHFMTVSKGIKRDLLECFDIKGDDTDVVEEFKRIVREYEFTAAELRGFDDKVNELFYEDKLPKRGWAVRLCFAFGLNEEESGHFLWKVCRLNGFSYRSAEDVVYCYCLANGESYQDAKALFDEYKSNPHFPNVNVYDKLVRERIKTEVDDYTVRTGELRNAFSNLKGMSKADFKTVLFEYSKYFINYSISAHQGIIMQYESVIEQMKKDRPADVGLSDTVEKTYKDSKGNSGVTYRTNDFGETGSFDVVDGDKQVRRTFDGKYEFTYDSVWRELAETSQYIDNTLNKETRPMLPISAVCNHVEMLVNALPPVEKLETIMKASKPESATDRAYGSARMVFIFFYFSQYVLRWERYLYDIVEQGESPEEFFGDFYEGLNNQLDSCGYGYLYYASPFDWHVLNCVRLLDESSSNDDELGALEQFNKAMTELVGDGSE